MTSSEEQSMKQPKILIPEVKLKARISELANEINHDYQGKEVTMVCVLNGSFIFFTEIIRQLEFPMTCEFLAVSSYGNKMVSSGEVKVTLDINEPLENRHVIVVEDLIESGLTLSYIMNLIKTRKPASLKSCSLLMKMEALKTAIEPDYLGFQIGKECVVGFGMDLEGQHRGLPYIGYIEHDH